MQTLSAPQTVPAIAGEEDRFIFVLQQHSGTYLVGIATNAAKRIAAINSGMNPCVKAPDTVKRIVGVKPCTAERTLISVFQTLEAKAGVGNVLAV